MSAVMEWKFKEVSFKPKKNTTCISVKDHPLKSFVVMDRVPRRIINSQSSTGSTTPVGNFVSILEPFSAALEGTDPLTELAFQNEDIDPLSKMAAEGQTLSKGYDKVDKVTNTILPWSARKHGILNKFTTSEKLSIVTSFLSEGEKVVVKAQSVVVDKVQHRLEQLDNFDETSQRKIELSQSEYVNRIDLLNKELVNAWHSEQRVKALKIAIQCAKLLSDTDVLSFYPSKFVLITDILDIFGQLVYERLRIKADYCKPGSKIATALPQDFTPDMVPETAKETCLNWFYKIASIRELVPRIYVEMALLKSYRYISLHDAPEALVRLTKMIHGIGNPLVAVYARCYLCRSGMNFALQKLNNSYLFSNFTGFLETYHQVFSRSVTDTLSRQHMSLPVYMGLFTPALDFILEVLALNGTDNTLNDILQSYEQEGSSSLMLNTIMSTFKPNFIALHSIKFLNMIKECSTDGIPVYVLLRTLGLCLSVSPPRTEQRKQVLSVVWSHLSSFRDIDSYMTCLEAWITYVVKYFTVKEINTVFRDIINHLHPNRDYEKFQNQLKLIVEKTVSHINDFESLLVMDNFLPLLDFFQQESDRVDICKIILSSCNSENRTSDPVVINAVTFLCTILHDSVNALTPDDEFKQIGQILCNVIRKVDYGTDFEQQLSFYVEARGCFPNVDAVLIELIQSVNSLVVRTRDVMLGLHNRKTGDFVRACAAYCFITIPSITSVKSRLELYLLSGQVALYNQCLGQADACFRAILTVIPELQEDPTYKNELFITPFIRQFLSALLVIPDNPDQGVLSLTRSLLNILQHYDWDPNKNSILEIYFSVIDLLYAMAQDDFVYHIDKVESNDALYGSDPKFIAEINKMSSIVVGEVLNHLKQMGPSKRQSMLALELFVRTMTRSDLNHSSMANLAVNLWHLSLKHGHCDLKLMQRIKDYFRSHAANFNNISMQRIIEKLG